jgi:hypothetical protein
VIVLVTVGPAILAYVDSAGYWMRHFKDTGDSMNGPGSAMFVSVFWAAIWPVWVLGRFAMWLNGDEERRMRRARRAADLAELRAREARALAERERNLGIR